MPAYFIWSCISVLRTTDFPNLRVVESRFITPLKKLLHRFS